MTFSKNSFNYEWNKYLASTRKGFGEDFVFGAVALRGGGFSFAPARKGWKPEITGYRYFSMEEAKISYFHKLFEKFVSENDPRYNEKKKQVMEWASS